MTIQHNTIVKGTIHTHGSVSEGDGIHTRVTASDGNFGSFRWVESFDSAHRYESNLLDPRWLLFKKKNILTSDYYNHSSSNTSDGSLFMLTKSCQVSMETFIKLAKQQVSHHEREIDSSTWVDSSRIGVDSLKTTRHCLGSRTEVMRVKAREK